jgi:cell division protein FtsW
VKKVDKTLFYLVISLTFLGLVAVADASTPQALANFNDRYYFLKQQGLWAGIGIVAFFVALKIKYTFWEKIATPLFFASIILLILVLFPSFSYKALGARRWIDVGLISFQPSEIIKLSLILYFAKLAKVGKSAISYFLPLVVIVGLIMLQPDLGTALVVSAVAFTQIFVSGVNLLHFFGALVVGGVTAAILVLTSSYRRDRLHTFLEVTSDPLGKGYHIRQILLALGSGGIFGVGIGASRQKYLFLPEAATDSIFAIIAEEMGLIGAVLLIFLFALFIFKGFKISRNSPDKFSQMLATGITAWIGGQAFLNIASMVALTPLTGIPLPFFSYGGSSLVMILAACGILINISSHESQKITSRR